MTCLFCGKNVVRILPKNGMLNHQKAFKIGVLNTGVRFSSRAPDAKKAHKMGSFFIPGTKMGQISATFREYRAFHHPPAGVNAYKSGASDL